MTVIDQWERSSDQWERSSDQLMFSAISPPQTEHHIQHMAQTNTGVKAGAKITCFCIKKCKE